jgi:serine protease
MRIVTRPRLVSALAASLCLLGLAQAASPEWNPVRTHPVEIGPQANRLLVGFRPTAGNAVTKVIKSHSGARIVSVTQAQTSATDLAGLTERTQIATLASRQITPSMHVIFLQKTLYGADVAAVLERLRADPAVAFADVDERRYPHAIPNDPFFVASANATGQWFMQTPNPAGDASATDAVSAWNITQGSSGTVIADVDSGVLFTHPDLLRAGFGGRLLPGYDFVGQDLNASNSAKLGTFLIANDGDGWDPDPSDPGDWIDSNDLKNTAVFPTASCSPATSPTPPSSWHGTRVMGVLGALTNNGVGVAGMTWNPYLLPVRALGKCGGFDSDIIAGIQWAAGMSVVDNRDPVAVQVPDNPYPADIINLSLGGSGSCPSSYQNLVAQLTGMGVLVVASAGNENGPVDTPGNCAGVLAVAGLRNVGTKVGYSSMGAEVGIAAPAGNCVNSSGACLRSIDTTSNDGPTVPGNNTYTNQINPNLGTSFSAPIVSGVAALMRAVNGNLTPPQLIARIQASATAFPTSAATGVPQCPTLAADGSGQCACVPGQCGAGMVNAFAAVKAALNPIAAVKIPNGVAPGTASYDASGSVGACNTATMSPFTIKSYAWSVTGGVSVPANTTTPQAMVTWNGSNGTLMLTVTDSAGNVDTDTVTFKAGGGATTTGPSSGGSAANACPTPKTVTPAAPTVTQAFAPASVAVNATSVLTLTFNNANAYALTQSGITVALPASLTLLNTPAPATTCTGSNMSLTSTASGVTLSGAIIPVNGACTITMSVKSAAAGTYTNTIAANALMTGPAGGNTAAAADASLTVTSGNSNVNSTGGGGGGGGGALDWMELMAIAGVLLAARSVRARNEGEGARPG